VNFSVKEVPDGQLECNVNLSANMLRERHAAPGTSLDVGEPIFYNASGSAVVTVTPGQTVALLTGIGAESGDTMLTLLRIDRKPSATEESVRSGDYALDSRIIKVRGEPDWKFWMQPYARAAQIYAGAGQALGPVEIPRIEKRLRSFDWARLGFSHVKASEPEDTDHPGNLNQWLEPRFGVFQKTKELPYQFGATATPIDPSHPVFEAFRQVAPDAPPMQPEEIQGKALTVSMTTRIGADGKPGTYCEYLAYGAAAREDSGACRIDWRVLMNSPHIATRENYIRRELKFSTVTDHDAMLAYLLPIANDEFWIVLTDFKVRE
jgi:hypothetical protein